MSKIDDLIQEFCPDGVEYKPIKKLAEVGTGSSNGNEAQEDGKYPFFIRSQTVKRKNEWEYDEEAIIIPGEGGIGEIYHYVNGKYAIHQRVYRIHFTDNSVDVKFAYHYFRAFFKNFIMRKAVSATVKSIRKPMIEEFMLPVPPLEVQREIVHILDSFTLLTAELTAELTARKKQYNFYRDKLLTFESDIPLLPIKEVVKKSCAGATPAKGNPEYYEDGTIPWIRTQDVRFNEITEVDSFITEKAVEETAAKWIPENCVIVAISGATAGRCAINKIKATTNQHCLNMQIDNEKALYKYVYYCICSKQDELISKKQGARGDLNSSLILGTKIPVPKLEIQKKIVHVLDNFESICSDLNIGLPAEIEARQKQYEYYRDLLLTFAETGSTLMTDRQTELSAIKLIQYVFGYVTLPMGSLFDFRNGLSKGKDFFGSGIPFIRYTDVYNNRFLKEEDITALVECTPAEIEKLGVHRGDVFFTRTSETAEDVGWSSVMLDDIGDCVFNGFTIKATPKTNYLLPEYCAFCFATEDFRKYVTSHCAFTTRASLTGKTIAEYQLAVPSIEKQQEIVNVLNKFHSICNDLSAGLPAEIEARQKQYEYYRDKLLSFKELPK